MKNKIISIISKNIITLLFYTIISILTMQELSVWYKGGDMWFGQNNTATKVLMIILLALGIITIIIKTIFEIKEEIKNIKQ